MDSLPLGQRLIKSIKWIVLFVVLLAYFKPGPGQKPGMALGFLVCIPLYFAFYRVLYGRIEELFEGLGYMFTPDILSLLFGELLRDWEKSTKLAILLGLCFFSAFSANSYYQHSYELISRV